MLTSAIEQATRVGRQNRFLPLIVGLIGTTVTATIMMGQLERATNRIYGIEKDRPFAEKYTRALVLAVTAGFAIGCSFALLAFGRGLIDDSNAVHSVVARPPLAARDRAARNRARRALPLEPATSAAGLGMARDGAVVAMAGWTLATAGLALIFSQSSTFGEVYGPLAGLVGLQLWSFFSALGILYGVAVAAQLEAVRAGVSEPQDEARLRATGSAQPASVA